MIPSPLLEHVAGWVGGCWIGSSSGRTLKVINPATGEILAEVPDLGAAETEAAILAAERALADPVPVEERRRWLQALADSLMEQQGELARIITLEQGKPLREAGVEVEYAAGFFQFFAGQLDRLQPDRIESPIRGARWTVHHRPAGVVGLITPWNFPLAMLAKKLSAALASGCAAVIKPSELTPLSAIALAHLVERAGVPVGRVNLVVGQPAPIGRVLCEHPGVRLLSFTGSTRTGRLLLRDTAPHVKRLALELGGNAPFLVFEDADLERAADALVANKFRCAGQTCVCANRVYVQRAVAARFVELLVARVARLRVGNGMEPGMDMGPLIHRAAFDKVARHVAGALARGATRVLGADPKPTGADWGCFYPPTILTGVPPDLSIFQEEIFGPVIAVAGFDSEDEVLPLANGTPCGLAAYVFTRDAARAQRCAARLQFGHVALNSSVGPVPEAPFGGMKQSGIGREGGAEGLLEFCETQTVATA